jgi:uncharacterized protein DUF6328
MSGAEKAVKIALDECRVLMLGAQILFGFHLRAAFQEQFANLSPAARVLYVFAFVAMAVVLAFLIAPSMQHRIVERGRTSGRIVQATTLFAGLALAPFAFSLGADIAIVFSFKFGAASGAALGVAFAGLALALWYGIEYLLRRPNGKERAMPEEPHTPIDVRVEHMLTESRVLLPGAQALFGFQLTVLLTVAFDKLAESSKLAHAFALCSIAVAIILLMAPAALHRITFGGRNTERFHRMGSGFVVAAAVPLALGIGADIYVAVAKAVGSAPIGAAVACALAALLAALWFVQPLALRHKRLAPHSQRTA